MTPRQDPDLVPVGSLVPGVVVIAGATASGKSTLARYLARAGGLRRLAASSLLLNALDPAAPGKRERLLSWVADPEMATARRCADATVDRMTDLAVLAACRGATEDMVVESSGSVALLQPVDTVALLVLLDAAAPVRAARIHRSLAGAVTGAQAHRIVAAKDAATAAAVRAAWALDLSDLATCGSFDLVIRCPDRLVCRHPATCRRATRELCDAAVSVYIDYLAGAPAGEAAWQMATLAKQWRRWLVRLSPALTDAAGPHTPARWRARLGDELVEPGHKPSEGTEQTSC